MGIHDSLMVRKLDWQLRGQRFKFLPGQKFIYKILVPLVPYSQFSRDEYTVSPWEDRATLGVVDVVLLDCLKQVAR